MSCSSREPNRLHALRRLPLAIAGLGAIAFLAACGFSAAGGSTAGSSANSSGSPTATPAATPSVSCAQVTALRAALTKLVDIRVNGNTVGQVSADLASIEKALTALKSETRSAFSAEASQVSAALTMISKHAKALSAHPSPANLRATTTAIGELKTAVGPTIAMMRTACPSS
jgi:hypothetical protein